MSKTSNPLISVTVCVRDGVHWIDDCLQSLVEQTYRPLEIIAVDDGSTDGSTEKLTQWKNYESDIKIKILTQGPKGLSAGRQLALENSNGTWVAITDIDVRPSRTWIEKLYEKTLPIDENEKVVAVTGRTIFARADDLVSQLRSVEISLKYRSRPRRTSLANGPCSMFKKSAITEIGGFDPQWYHAEDMEVSLKLIENGGTIVYNPEAIVEHVPESSRARFLAKRSRDARAHTRIVRKYPRKKRLGPGFDFIGSSTIVLAVLPLWVCLLVSVIPFTFYFIITDDKSIENIRTWWQTNMLFISLAIILIQEIIFVRGPLGAVIRGSVSNSGKNRVIVYFGLKVLTIQWSLALWKGPILGLFDMLLGRNGH